MTRLQCIVGCIRGQALEETIKITLYSFRHAQKSDLNELLEFIQSRQELFYFFPSASYPLTLAQLETQLCERHESTVMLEDGQLVGFANFYNVGNHNIAFIGNVIIKPEKRRQGLGSKLLQAMIETGFQQLQLNEVHLSCYARNTSALLFYSKLGFRPYAIEGRPDPENETQALIHLKIKNHHITAPN